MDTQNESITDEKRERVLATLAECGEEHEQLRYAKEALAIKLAKGNEELAEAIFLAFDEIEDELGDGVEAPKMLSGSAAQNKLPDGWPDITRGELVVLKDMHWTVMGFTKHGIELRFRGPTAALLKRVGKRAEKRRKHARQKNSRGKRKGPAQPVSLKPQRPKTVEEVKSAADSG